MRNLGILIAALLLALGLATPASACTVTSSANAGLGAYSPPAIRQGAVPALQARGGLSCTPSVLVLLGTNYIRAKFQSQNGMKLLNGSNAIAYTASANPTGTVAFTNNGTVDYMQNNLLNLLGLLGGSSADFPFYVKPSSATLMPEGTYTDRITIAWDWYICQGLSVLGCIGTPDQGTGNSVIDVTLTVVAKRIVVTMSQTTTWDPVNGISYPKALPGSRQRVTAAVANPDIVAIDSNAIALSLAVPQRTAIVLAGDGSLIPGFVLFADGAPTSKIALSYASPESTTDDVDFSADGGVSWSYVPVAGNDASQAAVTHIRLRPRGAMAATSGFTVSYPVRLK